MKSRAAVRRALAELPDAGQLTLAAAFADLAGGLPEAGELLAGYLFDPRGGALLATTDARASWLAKPLFTTVGPGNAAPVDDVIAALIAGPILAKGGVLSPVVMKQRFAPRADDAVAIAVAALPRPAQLAALDQLAADGGPDAATLALSTVQCGRVLAWSPHLLEAPIADRIVAALVALLHPTRPRPLLDAVARALGPLAATPGSHGDRIRDAAFAGIEAAHRPPPSSFAAEIASIGKPRTVPDQDRMLALPAREVAAACAYILGYAAPNDRGAFAAHRTLVLDRPDGGDLWQPFVDGLIAGAHVAAIAELAATLLLEGGAGVIAGLGLAAALPLDSIAGELIAMLDTDSPLHRALACAAVELLVEPSVDAAVALRLGDPSPEVAAAAARTLVARDRRDLIDDHGAREPHPIRRAIAAAALGDLGVPVIGELVNGLLADLDDEPADASPIARLLAETLVGSSDGLETAANLMGGVPETAGLLALALADARDVGVLAPPTPRTHLATVALRIATDAASGPELGTLALCVLARVSAGDTTIADVIADALDETEGYAGNLVAALGELRVATPRTSEVLAALVAPDQPLGARVLAAAACGRALAADHDAWRDVRELLELGTIARAAAWSALRDRARRR